MKTFKFLTGTLNNRWMGIVMDRYKFRIQTHLSTAEVAVELRNLMNAYMRMWDDDMNRDRLLELLHTKFQNAVNVLDRNEIIR